MRATDKQWTDGFDPLTRYLALRAADFAHPREVLADGELDPAEKRSILAAWASDASAVASHPQFRWLTGTPGPIPFSHILAAIRALDNETEEQSALFPRTHAGSFGAARVRHPWTYAFAHKAGGLTETPQAPR